MSRLYDRPIADRERPAIAWVLCILPVTLFVLDGIGATTPGADLKLISKAIAGPNFGG